MNEDKILKMFSFLEDRGEKAPFVANYILGKVSVDDLTDYQENIKSNRYNKLKQIWTWVVIKNDVEAFKVCFDYALNNVPTYLSVLLDFALEMRANELINLFYDLFVKSGEEKSYISSDLLSTRAKNVLFNNVTLFKQYYNVNPSSNMLFDYVVYKRKRISSDDEILNYALIDGPKDRVVHLDDMKTVLLLMLDDKNIEVAKLFLENIRGLVDKIFEKSSSLNPIDILFKIYEADSTLDLLSFVYINSNKKRNYFVWKDFEDALERTDKYSYKKLLKIKKEHESK